MLPKFLTLTTILLGSLAFSAHVRAQGLNAKAISAVATRATPQPEAADEDKTAELRRLSVAILNDLRLIDGAKDQCAIENNRKGSETVLPQALKPYFKDGSRLFTQAASGAATFTDLLGNPIALNNLETPPTISAKTRDALATVVPDPKAFWTVFLAP